MSDEEIDRLENEFPTLAAPAFAAARARALASGLSVLQSEGDAIYEVFPDGRRIFVKKIQPPTHYPPGTTFRLR